MRADDQCGALQAQLQPIDVDWLRLLGQVIAQRSNQQAESCADRDKGPSEGSLTKPKQPRTPAIDARRLVFSDS